MKAVYGIDAGANIAKFARIDPTSGNFDSDMVTLSLEDVTTNKERSQIIISELEKNINGHGRNEIGIGVCAAGVVDPKNLVINDSPNSTLRGLQTFPRDLKDRGFDVVLTNDMPAAVQDSAKFGPGKDHDHVVTITYSEGCGAALARRINGIPVNVTMAEIGHMLYQAGGFFCGCEHRGHLEPYVSGKGAESQARQFFDITHIQKHLIFDCTAERLKTNVSPDLVSRFCAIDIYNAWKKDPNSEPQKSIREIQVEAIKFSFGLMNSLWAPLDIIVCMGGQTRDDEVLFHGKDGAIIRYGTSGGEAQNPGLRKPLIVIADRPEIGISGAAAYYLSNTKKV
jgi:predicted NBD/HSP70 family sugar kinase